MNGVWYWPLLKSLRHHIELNHLDQKDAMKEIDYTEEALAYGHFSDAEKVKITCPWSLHCKCQWEIEGYIEFKLERFIDSNQP